MSIRSFGRLGARATSGLVTSGRLSTAAALAGLLPVLVVLLAVAALLYGQGYELPFSRSAQLGDPATTSAREAVAWLAGVAVGLLGALSVLPSLVRLVRGDIDVPVLQARHVARRRKLESHEVLTTVGVVQARLKGWEAERGLGLRSAGDEDDWVVRTLGQQVRQALGERDPRTPVDVRDLLEYVSRVTLKHPSVEADYFRHGGQEAWSELEAALTRDSSGLTVLYPVTGPVRSTQLGNALAASADRVKTRYGLDLMVVWPRFEGILVESERDTISQQKRRLLGLVSSTCGWGLASGAGVVTAALFIEASVALLVVPVAAALLARSTYVSAVGGAIELGGRVEAAVDLHRMALLDQMGFQRPRDSHEERAIFAQLSSFLSRSHSDSPQRSSLIGDPAADEILLRVASAVDNAVGDLDGRLGHQLNQTVGDIVTRSLHQQIEPQMRSSVTRALSDGVATTLVPKVREQLDSLFARPALTNFNGSVSIAVRIGEERFEPAKDGHIHLDASRAYLLTISIGPSVDETATSAPVLITGGTTADEADFGVVVDSDTRRWRLGEHALTVGTKGETKSIDLTLEPLASVEELQWLWVRVTQDGRTIQNLELSIKIGG
jgi:hypothetical protein